MHVEWKSFHDNWAFSSCYSVPNCGKLAKRYYFWPQRIPTCCNNKHLRLSYLVRAIKEWLKFSGQQSRSSYEPFRFPVVRKILRKTWNVISSSPDAALLLVSTKNRDLWLCKHHRLWPQPIRFVRLDSEHAQSDGESVNRGLPVLDVARGRDSWCWPIGARSLGTRMPEVQPTSAAA